MKFLLSLLFSLLLLPSAFAQGAWREVPVPNDSTFVNVSNRESLYNGRSFFVRQSQQYIRLYVGDLRYHNLEVRMCRDIPCSNATSWTKVSGTGVGYYDWHTFPQQQGKYILSIRYEDRAGLSQPFFEHIVYVMPPAVRAFQGTDVASTSRPSVPTTTRHTTMLLWSKGTTAAETLDRPMIIVEGIDAENKNDHASYLALGSTATASLFPQALDAGGDLLFLDFADGGRDMRVNAQQVIGAIEHIRTHRTPSAYNFDVAGVSMGGVVARYALAQFEQETWRGAHGVKHFVSIDAPQTGAVLDVAFQQYMIDHNVQPISLTCMAAKQLLRVNLFDSYGSENASFYTDLRNLNGGTGYPQQTENVGVSFGTPGLNPYLGQDWLSVDADTPGGGQTSIKKFTVLGDAGGSYLPGDVTRMWGYAFAGFASYELRRLYPVNPTFIPYDSALDIVGGISRFPEGSRFAPNRPYFHDEVPPEIVTPLLTRLGYIIPPAPLAVTMDGPQSVPSGTGTWTALVNRPNPLGATFTWDYRIVLPGQFCGDEDDGDLLRSGDATGSKGTGGIAPNLIDQCTWTAGGSGPSFSHYAGNSYRLDVRVTATAASETATAQRRVAIGSPGGGGGPLLSAGREETNELLADATMQMVREFGVLGLWPTPAQAGQPVQVRYGVPEASDVTLALHDLLGREIWRSFVASVQGVVDATVPTDGLPSGTYLLTVQTPSERQTRRLVLR